MITSNPDLPLGTSSDPNAMLGPGSVSGNFNYSNLTTGTGHYWAKATGQKAITWTWTPDAGKNMVTDPPPPYVIRHRMASAAVDSKNIEIYQNPGQPTDPPVLAPFAFTNPDSEPAMDSFAAAADTRDTSDICDARDTFGTLDARGGSAKARNGKRNPRIWHASRPRRRTRRRTRRELRPARRRPLRSTSAAGESPYGSSTLKSKTGEKWDVVDSSSGSVTADSPNMTADVDGQSYGSGTMSANISFTADITSVRLVLSGTTKDSSGNDNILVGQGAGAVDRAGRWKQRLLARRQWHYLQLERHGHHLQSLEQHNPCHA